MIAMYMILSLIIWILVVVAMIVLYFLPGIIAYKRAHANKEIILLLNFILGWTFLGWVGCLVWSLIDIDGSKTSNIFGNVNKYDNLAKLQELKESGAITEVEFEIEKKKLLG